MVHRNESIRRDDDDGSKTQSTDPRVEDNNLLNVEGPDSIRPGNTPVQPRTTPSTVSTGSLLEPHETASAGNSSRTHKRRRKGPNSSQGVESDPYRLQSSHDEVTAPSTSHQRRNKKIRPETTDAQARNSTGSEKYTALPEEMDEGEESSNAGADGKTSSRAPLPPPTALFPIACAAPSQRPAVPFLSARHSSAALLPLPQPSAHPLVLNSSCASSISHDVSSSTTTPIKVSGSLPAGKEGHDGPDATTGSAMPQDPSALPLPTTTSAPSGGMSKRLRQTRLVFTADNEELRDVLRRKDEVLAQVQKELTERQQQVVEAQRCCKEAEMRYCTLREQMRIPVRNLAERERNERRVAHFHRERTIGYLVPSSGLSALSGDGAEYPEMWVWGERYTELRHAYQRLKAWKTGQLSTTHAPHGNVSSVPHTHHASLNVGTPTEGGAHAAMPLPPPPPPSSSSSLPSSSPIHYVQARSKLFQSTTTAMTMTTATYRREELALREQLEDLERQKVAHLKEMRRIFDEDRSSFRDVCTIGPDDRYALIFLLGKGGFSEVWKAFDHDTGTYVALKIHTVRNDWTEERRRNYLRHSRRECAVHQQLDHRCVIRLLDQFVLNEDTFVTVLEYSSGTDLDTYLKRHGAMREADAKVILLQLLLGLTYLNEHPKERIIHYDLKPANILFTSDVPGCLDIKITDFGLCKVIRSGDPNHHDDDDDDDADDARPGCDDIELTSQGTGTYWYLPPECFTTVPPAGVAPAQLCCSSPLTPLSTPPFRSSGNVVRAKPPRVSQKVDVWAVGVIFFQMLYGRRPFGEGLSQKQLWRSGVIRDLSRKRATGESFLDIPTRPAVSSEAKQFLLRCLEPSVAQRADIRALMRDPYVVRMLT